MDLIQAISLIGALGIGSIIGILVIIVPVEKFYIL